MTKDMASAPPVTITDPAMRSLSTAALVTLFVALVARVVFGLWEDFDGSVSYEELGAFGDAYWPMNVLVFGPSFAIGFACQALLAWPLGRGGGRILARIGAGLLLLGGTVFALTATAHALPYDWAANHAILGEAEGRDAVAAFTSGGTTLLFPYILGSQLVIAVGAIVTVTGARISRTLPTWMLVATGLLVLVFVAAPIEPGSVPAIVFSNVQVVMWGVIGWFGWRASRA